MDKNCKIMNRDQIKYLAIILMTFNHIAHILLPSGTVIYEVFEDMGYFTSITMCYFMVEGYFYTHSRKDYAKRLLIFAFIAEIPFVLAMGYFQLDVMFTFFLCLCILAVLDRKLNKALKILSVLGLTILSVFCDCALILPIAAILFRYSRGNRKKQIGAWAMMCFIFFVLNIPGYAPDDAVYPYLSGYALLHSFYAIIAWIVAAIVILVFYNGKKSQKHVVLNKWLFYIYYPLHLLVLWGIHFFL